MCAHCSYSALASSTALKNSSIPIPISENTPTAWGRGRGSDGGIEAGRSREIESVREKRGERESEWRERREEGN